MKKVLNIEYPIITSYTQHAHMLSILGTNPNTFEWIISNYIQIYINCLIYFLYKIKKDITFRVISFKKLIVCFLIIIQNLKVQ